MVRTAPEASPFSLVTTFNRQNICLAMSATALKKIFLFSYVEKKVGLDCFNIHSRGLGRLFDFLSFTLFKSGFCTI
jgi:hypothetical protein